MDAVRLFTQGQVLPAFLAARSETLWHIGPFSRTCFRHLTFRGSGTPRQKKMAQMKEQIKAPEKIQLSDEEIANLSDAQFKTLVIRMLTELVEFGHKLDEKMKAMLSDIKENVQGTNSGGKETRTQINSVDQKEERNIQPEQNEETIIQKNEERLKNLQDIFKCFNIRIIGVPEGEEEEQNIENLFEKIMKESFPNLAKEIDIQEIQEAQSPKEVGPKEAHTKAHHNYITQDER